VQSKAASRAQISVHGDIYASRSKDLSSPIRSHLPLLNFRSFSESLNSDLQRSFKEAGRSSPIARL